MTKFKDMNWKLKSTAISATLLSIALFFFACKIGTNPEVYSITYLICISGIIFGWLIGMLTSPYNVEDENKLGKFSKLIGTFLSGYILSKFDRVIEQIINPESILSPLIGLRVLLFVCFFCLAWIITFVFRQYVSAS